MNNVLKNTLYLAGGALAGVIAGILIAPKSGKETRKDIKKSIDELQDKVESLSGEAKLQVETRIGQLKDTLKDVEASIKN